MRLYKILRNLINKNDEDDNHEMFARDFMKPRYNVEFIKTNDNLHEICEKFTLANDIILPVVIENYNVIGAIKLCSIINKDENWKNALLSTISIHENTFINRLLSLLNKYELIVCADEYGNCSGIVTKHIFTESILEKFILSDRIQDNELVVNGDTYLSEIDINFDTYSKTDEDTISSFVIELFNKIPEKGEFIIIGQYKIEILSANRGYVEKVRILKQQKE